MKSYVNRCPSCNRFAKHKKLRAPLQPWQVSTAREVLAMDYFGQGKLPETPRGNTVILTMLDLFTKFAAAFPLVNSTSETTIQAILHGWIYRHGPPAVILTDQGRNFESVTFLQFCGDWRIQHIHTSTYHPQTNAACERFNCTLKGKMNRLLGGGQLLEWDMAVPAAVFAYNTTVHSSTGFTPFCIMYGTEARIPGEMVSPRRISRSDTQNMLIRSSVTCEMVIKQ